MKKLILFLFILPVFACACGPHFPPSYITGQKSFFIENINIPMELAILAREYELTDGYIFADSKTASAQADRDEFNRAATALAWTSKVEPYFTYAALVRKGATNAVAPTVPDALNEFVLYLEGFREMQSNPELIDPEAWKLLLQLDSPLRKHRTTWVHYMLGNLASSHGQPDLGVTHYTACREAAAEGFADAVGLAHASYKREYLAQTNLTERIRKGVQAVAYYQLASDPARLKHCFEHLQKDLQNKSLTSTQLQQDALCKETAMLFLQNRTDMLQPLENEPPLKITPRLAWFMYKKGELEKAARYLASCPEDDVLANWLRFRIAQRNGETDAAVQVLNKWLTALQSSDRILYEFGGFQKVPPGQAVYGTLGNLYVSQNDMLAALDCFMKAGAFQDAALIAERYLETEKLQAYIDALPSTTYKGRQHSIGRFNPREANREYYMRWLLGRRLFRDGKPSEALPYYPTKYQEILKRYLAALENSENKRTNRNLRAAYLYQAARIMRWKGMELSGMELHPDYFYVGGSFPHAGIYKEERIVENKTPPIYKQSAPANDFRFHYRHIAAEMAGRAAERSWDRHQKALMLWSAGMWLEKRHPKEADTYYKQLARIRLQPLAKAADQQRWFPSANTRMEEIYRSENYIEPKAMAEAVKKYGND